MQDKDQFATILCLCCPHHTLIIEVKIAVVMAAIRKTTPIHIIITISSENQMYNVLNVDLTYACKHCCTVIDLASLIIAHCKQEFGK